jgi:Carboxypeptidase regulatory-like domain/TonB-dependent Receptor Plug Domain
MKIKFVTLVSVLALLLATTVIAFGQDTKGSVEGTVKDANGAVVPNATVEIKGVSLGFTRTATSNGEGVYVFSQIPVGIYKVSAVSTNLKSQSKEITVTLGNTSSVDIELAVTGATATVDIVATDNLAVDTSEAKVQTNITAAQIENLPKGTTFSSLLRTTASTRPEALAGGFQINGSSGAENSFVVDGQEVGNFRTGALNGNNDIPFQAVQEVQVKSSGFGAEFGGATGGVVSVVTKSGSNDYHGEMGAAFATQKLNAGPRPILANSFTGSTTLSGGIGASTSATGQFVEYFPQAKPGGNNFFPTVSLGGKIIKDKVWFYSVYSPQKFSVTQTTNFVAGYPGNGAGRNLISASNFASTLPDSVRNISPIQTSTAEQTNEFGLFKLDASPTNNLRFSGSYTWNPIIQKGLLQGSSTVIGTPGFADFGGSIGYLVGNGLASRQGGRQNSNNIKAEAVWTPNSNSVVTFRFSRGFLNEKLNSYFIPQAARIRCRTVSAALAAQAGCVAGFQTNTNNFSIEKDASVRRTFDADFAFSVNDFVGRHDFKVGYQNSKISNDVKDGYKPYGVVNLCYSTTLTLNSSCGGYSSPVAITVAPVPPAGQTLIGVGWVQRFATQGAASNNAQTFFFQDKWQPISRLTLNLGLRTEKEDLPAFNGQTTNLKFGFGEKLAPRLGVAFDLTGDGKTKISAFYGWYFDRLKFELPRGSFGGDFFRRDIFPIYSGTAAYTNYTAASVIGNYADPIGGACPIAQVAGTLTRCNSDFRIPSNLPNSATGAVDPDLKAFRQSEVTFEFQRELVKNSVLTVRYLYRNVDHAIEDAGWISPSGSETYIIANPGEGLHAKQLKALGYSKSVKPERKYKAVQVEYNGRFSNKFDLNANYTWSSLYGNYSGLASSDEGGRLSPGVNRFFDLPWIGWTAAGKPDNGKLATDRPHVFKTSGTYSFDWLGSKVNKTSFTLFAFAQSGTPLTTFVSVLGLPIPESTRGNLGRTPRHTQADFSLTHKYKFGSDNKFALAFDLNVLNLFNQSTVLGRDTNKTNNAWYDLDVSVLSATGNYVEAANKVQNGGVRSFLDAELTNAGCEAYGLGPGSGGFCLNQSYQKANSFQAPRSIRFGFRVIF